MIRVLLRNAYDVDGILLGDFPPSEIPELEDLIASTDIYSDSDSTPPIDVSRQFIETGTTNKRICLEIVWEHSEI